MHVIPDKALNRRPTLPARQQGAVAVIVALSLVGLIGIVGLALDLGKLFVAKSELQNSADACALAAARELTGANTNQLKLAEAAGIAIGQRHQVLFQGEKIVIKEVKFSPTLLPDENYAEADSADSNSRYARCVAERTGIANWFIQVLNLLPGVDIGEQTVGARAVASLVPGQTTCAIPAAICSDQLSPGTSVGDWLVSVIGPPGGSLSGQFKWVDLTGGSGSAAALSAQLIGPGVCDLPAIGASVGAAGGMQSLSQAWNSRFGIYHGQIKAGDVTPVYAAPDYSGYAYTEINHPSKKDAFKGASPSFSAQRSVNAAYQGDSDTGLSTHQGSVQDASFLKQHGRDRRLAIAAVVNCSPGTLRVDSWACVFMLHPLNYSAGGGATGSTRMYLEYLGPANAPDSPCASVGVAGGPGSSGPLVPALVR